MVHIQGTRTGRGSCRIFGNRHSLHCRRGGRKARPTSCTNGTELGRQNTSRTLGPVVLATARIRATTKGSFEEIWKQHQIVVLLHLSVQIIYNRLGRACSMNVHEDRGIWYWLDTPRWDHNKNITSVFIRGLCKSVTIPLVWHVLGCIGWM